MTMCRLSAVLARARGTERAVVEVPWTNVWSFVCRKGPLHFFMNPLSGGVMTLEITNDFFEVRPVCKLV